jgi:hypothetical protein
MHRYLVRLENSRNFKPRDTVSLLVDLRKNADQFGSVVKNVRITETAIEFDLFALDRERKEKTVRTLESEFGRETSERDLALEAPPVEDKKEVVNRCIELFNDQRYWECHETLEQIWRAEPKGAEKEVQQGIILAASALVHFQRNEDEVCLGMIPRTLSKLERWNERMYYEIDVDLLKAQLRRIGETKLIKPFKI